VSYFGKRSQRRDRSERWERENEAPRLLDVVGGLRSLRLELWESCDGEPTAGTRYIKHIIVARSAAHFEIPCSNPDCSGGGHDLSDELLAGLRKRQTRVRGTDACRGMVGDGPCKQILHYSASALFEDEAVSSSV
jgi:hypothetical protein